MWASLLLRSKKPGSLCRVWVTQNTASGVRHQSGMLSAMRQESCPVDSTLQVLGLEHGLGPLEPMQVSVYRSRASQGSKAVDSLHRMLVQTLRHAGT